MNEGRPGGRSPCLRAFGSLLPVTVIPVPSINRCSGPCEPRCERFTASVFCRRSGCYSRAHTSSDQPAEVGSRRIRLSAEAPSRTRLSWSGGAGRRRHRRQAVAQACQWIVKPKPGGVEPHRQRSTSLERLVIRGPVQGSVGLCVRSAHPHQLSR